MKNAWPTPEEERAKTWRHMSLIVQIVFFFLTLFAMSALYGFCSLLRLPAGRIILVSSIAVAELLIRRAHFWRTGVESALWLGGLYSFIFSLPHSGKPEAFLVLAAAAALAGWRVRNALFGALAATLVVAYFEALHSHWAALFLAIAIALIALVGQTLQWKRPSTELLWQIIAIVMPVAGYLAIVFRDSHFVTDGRVVAIFLGVAVVFAIVGIRRRLRVPFVVATIAIAIAIVEAHDYMPVSVEAELIMVGAVTLAIAGAIMRSLRDKKTGFVLGVAKQSDLRDALSVAPTLLSVHGADSGTPSQHAGGGGEFGGAGASGNY
ncbi:MAG TPA: hypothetical protein VII32_15035 [Thermoanaerobaculia bacterium]